MNVLTADDISAQVESVKAAVSARDYPLAFSLEITIWHDALEAIHEGSWEAQDLATAALQTLAIKFPRSVGS